MQEKNPLNNFKDVLGKYCAINQFIELSKRCFITEHKTEIGKRETFIELATKHAITLTNFNAEEMVNEICRSYIVNVNLCFETFLKDVYHQMSKYGKNEFKDRQKEESYLTCVVRNLDVKLPKDMQSLYELCEYYRLIRNTAVHDLCDIKSHEKEFRKLQKYDFKTEAKFAKLVAPNDYDNISFDDFVMFARSCVELATYLFKELPYNYEKIIMDIPREQLSKWRRYDEERLEKVIYSYINTLYKIDDSLKDQIPYLVDMILAR